MNSLALLRILQERFVSNPTRHPGVSWEKVEQYVRGNTHAIRALSFMEETGGEPDVVAYDNKSKTVTFVDCSKESPSLRRSLCYDKSARLERKAHAPDSSVMEMIGKHHVQLLTAEEYRTLQALGVFDTTTSSWLATPTSIRALGGALFGDRRYDTVFTYHNGASSYYASRGFRVRYVAQG